MTVEFLFLIGGYAYWAACFLIWWWIAKENI